MDLLLPILKLEKKNRMKMTKGTQLMVVRRWEAGKGEGGER